MVIFHCYVSSPEGIYIYIHTFSEKNLGCHCHCHSILSRQQRRSALARCFHGIYSLQGSCRRTWTTAVWSSSANGGTCNGAHFAWENAWWIPGECWWPWIERSEKMWKMGKAIRKMIHKWLVLHIFSYRRKNLMRPVMSNSRLSSFDSNMVKR